MNVTVADPWTVPFATSKVIVCAVPGVRTIVAGDAWTPAGSPLIWTDTCEENPFEPVAVRETPAEPPTGMRTEVGFTPREKSPIAEGGDWLTVPPPLLPQPDSAEKQRAVVKTPLSRTNREAGKLEFILSTLS